MLFLSDLDGTLMDSNGNVTDEDVECIHHGHKNMRLDL